MLIKRVILRLHLTQGRLRRGMTGSLAMVVAGAACLLAPLPATAQNLREVSLYVTVAQGGDKLIGGLPKENFRLYEDGKAQEFRLETPEKPISIALLVEYSQSSGPYLNDVNAAVDGFLNAAAEGNWYALATFSRNLEVNVDYTKAYGKIREAFAGLGQPSSSEIDTFDAVYDTLEKLGRLSGRRVLVIIGSGLNSFSAHGLDDVRKKIQSTDVTVYAVGVGSLFRARYSPYLKSHHQMTLLQAESFLRMLTDESGGEAWFPRFEAAFRDVTRGIVQNLDFQYRLVYMPAPSASDSMHKIKVEAFNTSDNKRQSFKVFARPTRQF